MLGISVLIEAQFDVIRTQGLQAFFKLSEAGVKGLEFGIADIGSGFLTLEDKQGCFS